MKRAYLPIQLRARSTYPGLLAIVATTAFVWAMPALNVSYPPAFSAVARIVPSREWAPVALAVLLAVAMAPRLPQWDARGGPKLGVTALVVATACAGLPALICVAGAFRMSLHNGSPVEAHILPTFNVLAMGLIACALVGTCGAAIGGTVAGVMYLALVFLQGAAPGAVPFLPLMLGYLGEGLDDTAVRWVWLVVLGAGVAAICLLMHCVPFRALRPAPEYQD